MENLSPKENFEFNMKRPVREGFEIGFKDGNPENTKFANLIEVPAKPKKEAKKEAPKEAKQEEVKEEKKEGKKSKK